MTEADLFVGLPRIEYCEICGTETRDEIYGPDGKPICMDCILLFGFSLSEGVTSSEEG